MNLNSTGSPACSPSHRRPPPIAGVSADEAKTLGTTLTAIGAEKAGNKDGTIPAYTGGLTTAPAGFKAGDGMRPDPFAAEKPRLQIDAKNMAQHAATADRRHQGADAEVPDLPRRRLPDASHASRSRSSSTDNTAKNAVRQDAERRPLDRRRARRLPVPDPEDRQRGDVEPPGPLQRPGLRGQVPQPERRRQRPHDARHRRREHPGISRSGTTARPSAETYWRIKLTYTGPARRAGEALMLIDPLDIGTKDRRAWSYLPGQRRVKVAPDLSHDTPNPGTAGATTFDDTFIFNGSMDRFDFKLVGKKEMLVPVQRLRGGLPGQAGRPAQAQPPEPRPGALGAAPRVGRRSDAEGRQAPRLQQAHLLPRRGLLGGGGERRVRRPRPALPHRLRLHGAELRPARAVHRHVRPLRPGLAPLFADRLHRRDRRPAPHQAARRARVDGRLARRQPAFADAARTITVMQRRTLLKACRGRRVPACAAAARRRRRRTGGLRRTLARRARHAGAAQPARPDAASLTGLARAGKRVVAVGQRGHVLLSDDAGKTWQQADVPVSADLVAVSLRERRVGLGGRP